MSLKKEPKKRKKTMFGKPKSKEIADIVGIESPKDAERSTKQLEERFKQESKRDKKVHIIRAATLAANRAEASAIRVSPKERKEMKKVASIYRESVGKMSKSIGMTDSIKEHLTIWKSSERGKIYITPKSQAAPVGQIVKRRGMVFMTPDIRLITKKEKEAMVTARKILHENGMKFRVSRSLDYGGNDARWTITSKKALKLLDGEITERKKKK